MMPNVRSVDIKKLAKDITWKTRKNVMPTLLNGQKKTELALMNVLEKITMSIQVNIREEIKVIEKIFKNRIENIVKNTEKKLMHRMFYEIMSKEGILLSPQVALFVILRIGLKHIMQIIQNPWKLYGSAKNVMWQFIKGWKIVCSLNDQTLGTSKMTYAMA
jgi:hypothetical protein